MVKFLTDLKHLIQTIILLSSLTKKDKSDWYVKKIFISEYRTYNLI